jgi:hypothetical protein
MEGHDRMSEVSDGPDAQPVRVMAGRLAVVVSAVAVAMCLVGCSGQPDGAQDPNPAVLAPQMVQSGAAVDGIPSSATEQVLFHIHSHLQIYVNGTQKLIPYGIGIVAPYQLTPSENGPFVSEGKAFYWLHTHDETGVIHVESPVQRSFTLGNFFDMWGQPLSPDQVGPARGPVTAFVNGRPFAGNPREIPLSRYAVIQLDVGTPTESPKPYTFAPDLS